MKRIISLVLSLSIIMSLLGGLDLSVFATTETTNIPPTKLIDIDIYKAQCLAGIAYDPNSNVVELCNSMYSYYINDNIHSPTQTFLEECYSDDALMADYTEWMAYSLAASPSSALDYVMKKEDYYETLIIAMYTKALTEDSEWKKIINNKIVNDTTNILSGLCDVLELEQASQLDEVLDLSDPKTFEYVSDTVENYYPAGTAGKVVGVIGTALKYGKNITDACQRISTYNAMVELDISAKLWLNQMYESCDGNTDPSLKVALLDLKSASTGFAEAALVDIKEVSFSLANWGIQAVMDYGVAQLASLNPITASVVVGLQAGKTICNVFFATDDVCEQLFLMECIYDVQYLSRTVADECKATFVNAQTKDNALAFSFSVDCYYESIINVDIDCMIKFLDKLYNGGILKGFLKWVYGATDDYDECVAALESLRTTRSHNYSAMNDYFKQALYINYPETYEYFFVMEQVVPITGIGFQKYTILPPEYPADYANIIVDSFSYVNVYFEPSNTTQKAYTLTSDNPSVLEINDGVMTAKSEGSANVTVTSLDNPAISYTSEIKVGAKLIDVDIDTSTTRFKYVIDNNEITITGLISGYEPETLRIPEAISEYPVTKIADFAFLKNDSIKSITLPPTITEIGDYAFYKCSALVQIDFSKGLKVIGDGAFGNCSALIGAVLPSTVTTLGLSAFENCTSLLNVQLSNSITELKDRTFYNCDSLGEITISQYVTKFGKGIFGGCNSLKSVYIGNNCKSIKLTSNDFRNINASTVADGVEIIDTMCFYGTDLYSVAIPNTIKTIGGYIGDYSDLNHIFYEGTESKWSSLMSKAGQYGSTQTLDKIKNAGHIHFEVSLQNNTTIKDEIAPTCIDNGSNNIYCNICNELLGSESIPATGHVARLVQKVIPTCIESGYSKYYCVVCEEEYITDYVKATNKHNYDENGSCIVCDKNIYFDYSISNGEVTITGYLADKDTVNIPNHIEFLPVKHISDKAFEGCTNIKDIKLSDSIISIGERSFYNCKSIESIDITNSVISIGEYAFSNCSNLKTITIGSAVTSIGNYSFADCINVVQINYNAIDASKNINVDSYNLFENAGTSSEGIRVIVGNNVKTIPENLFWSHNHKDMYVPPKVTSVLIGRNCENIGNGAFARCSDLTNITFSGNKLTTIEDEAFSGCNFSSISFPNSLKNIGWRSFAGCPLETLIIPDSVTSIGIGAFDCETINVVDTGNGVLNLDGFDFSKYQKLESVVIGNSVAFVPESCFRNCYNLKKIVLGEKIEHIGANAFQNGTGLTELIIPNNVATIDSYAFEGCTNLTDLTLGDRIATIGKSAFENCTSIIKIELPDTVVSIGSSAFKNCTKLEIIDFGTGIKEVGDYAFNNCTAVSTLRLPDSVTAIGEKAFYNCCISGTLTIPENVTYIGDEAFYGNCATTVIYNAKKCYMSFYDEYTDPDSPNFDDCVAINNSFSIFPNCHEIIFGNSVTFIPTSLLSNNTNITTVVLPQKLIRIQPAAFGRCSNLKEISIANNLESVGFYAFDGCDNLESVNYSGENADWDKIYIEDGNDCLVNAFLCFKYDLLPDGTARITRYVGSGSIVNIPETLAGYTVTSIGYAAFHSCTELTEVTIPDTVKQIDTYAFYGCTKLENIDIPPTIENIGMNAFESTKWLESQNDGIIYIGPVLYKYKGEMPENTVVTVKDGTICIAPYAFAYCANLSGISIPDSVSTVGAYAFAFCTGLKEITIPDSVTIINEGTFSKCSGLKTVNFPSSLSKIGSYAFDNTLWYESMPDGAIYINDLLYKYKGELTQDATFYIKEGTTKINEYAFRNCTGINEIIIPESITIIGRCAFAYCDSVTSIQIPDTVVRIGEFAFANCDNLNNVQIPDSVIDIDMYAFEYCRGLTNIKLPNTINEINIFTFSGCKNLVEITIPRNVELISGGAFWNCANLSKITILNPTCEIVYDEFNDIPYSAAFVGYENSTAQLFAETYGYEFISLGDAPDKTIDITDSETNVSITTIDDVELNVELISDVETITNINSKLTNSEVMKLYDITLIKDNKIVQPSSPVIVKIPTDHENSIVYRIDESDTLTDMGAAYVDGYMMFTTEHFSKYVLTVPKDEESYILGDVDGNGNITIMDATAIQLHIAQLEIIPEDKLACADTDGDGTVAIMDATQIQLFIAQIIPSL